MRVLVVLLCLLSACCASTPNVYERAKPATVRLEWSDGRVCSGVATGPHSVLTAAHCVEDAPKGFTIDGKPSGWSVVADDGSDHVVLRVTLTQHHLTAIRPRAFRPGETLFVWGNPDGLANVLRIGRIAGTDPQSDLCIETIKRPKCAVVYLDGNLFHGDSGAAIFDASGSLVGLDSAGYTDSIITLDPMGIRPPQVEVWTLPFFYPLAFTTTQLRLARG